MEHARTSQLTPRLTGLILGLTLIKAGNVVASKIVVNDIDAFSAVFYRTLLGGLFLVLVGAVVRRAPVAPWRFGWLGWLTAAVFATNFTLFYLGTARTDASRVAVIVNLQPLVVALLAPAFFPAEQLTARKAFGMGIALAGVLCIVGVDAWHGAGFRLGDGLIFAAMVLWATGAVLEKRVLETLPAERAAISVVVWNLAFLLAIMLGVMAVTGWRPAPTVGPAATYALAYMVVLGSGMFLAGRWVVQRAPVSLVTSFNFLLPVWGVLFSVLLLGETLTPALLTGMALVAAGIAVVNRPIPVPALPAPVTPAICREGSVGVQ